VARKIKAAVPEFVAADIDVVYFPQIGYLITLPANINRRALRDEEFQFQVCYIHIDAKFVILMTTSKFIAERYQLF
jgi:hypothetical protein